MVRFRLGDPGFLSQFADKSNARLSFIWVNEQENLLFAIKQAVQSGGSIAMKCDRVGYSAKLETFEFLGAQRSFPFTIYHLGILFQMPVTFCVSLPDGPDRSEVRGFPIFEPKGDSKTINLQRARVHFQHVLTGIEALLRTNPYLWFNFDPLNPVAAPAPAPVAFTRRGTNLAACRAAFELTKCGSSDGDSGP
jgi:predicted LPLAT superfamily acyltransferase